jgi:hypothetical protein
MGGSSPSFPFKGMLTTGKTAYQVTTHDPFESVSNTDTDGSRDGPRRR